MSKWMLESGPELVPVPIDSRHFKQLLAEIAGLLLDSYCQLRRTDPTFESSPIGTVTKPEGIKRRQAEREGSHES